MEFIATVNRGGHRPTGREINQWRLHPDPKPQRRGKLLEPEVPAVPARRIRKGRNLFGSLIDSGFLAQITGASTLVDSMQRPGFMSPAIRNMLNAGLVNEDEVVPAKPGKPAVYAPDKPAEKFLAHLRRLGWIERDSRRRYGVTPLGHALLKADIVPEVDEGSDSVMVLDADDEFAYGKMIGVIADCGDALIRDRYLTVEQLAPVIEHTNASRFLVYDKLPDGKLAQLAIQISTAPPNDYGAVRELRQAGFHDRLLIGDEKVFGITASLNGISKSTAMLIEMPETAAVPLRAEAEEQWETGKFVARGLQPDGEGDDGPEDAPDDSGVETDPSALASDDREIRHEAGAYMHDGCDVRHRTRETAARCKRGA